MTFSLEEAIRLYEAGKSADAESACRALLQANPADANVLNLLGMIAGQNGRLSTAEAYFRQALKHAPNRAVILSNLAESLRLQGRHSEALPFLHSTASLAPEHMASHFKLALTLMELGRTDEALMACRTGLNRLPNEPTLNGLAANLLIQQGRAPEAVRHLYVALDQAPEVSLHWMLFKQLLSLGSLSPEHGRPWLLKALAHPAIRPTGIAHSISMTLCKDPGIARLVRQAESDALPRGRLLTDELVLLASDELLMTLMDTTKIPSTPLERLFTGMRRRILHELETMDFPPAALRFCAALANQAFLTDYAWFQNEEETCAVNDLLSRLEAALQGKLLPDALPLWLTVVGAYLPLHQLDGADEIARRSWPAPMAKLIRSQVSEPLEECALKPRIPAITPVSDPVSTQVRAQYEENPYPRWTRAEQTTPISLPEILHRLGAVVPSNHSFASPEALIAGCGTGLQSIIAASNYERAKVLAVDLSLTSLAYACRKSRELGIDHIEYRHGDILELGSLGRRFHLIECVGVLHHLADPIAGWRILVNLLQPGGLMRIGLYSKLARRSIVSAREQIAAQGYTATAADIRRCRRDILDLPDDNPLASVQRWRDFFNVSECRDLLFHVQEHHFTVPKLKSALDNLGLRFLGFDLADTAAYLERFPDDPRMLSLDNWHAFEQDNPDTFFEMYQFWAQKI